MSVLCLVRLWALREKITYIQCTVSSSPRIDLTHTAGAQETLRIDDVGGRGGRTVHFVDSNISKFLLSQGEITLGLKHSPGFSFFSPLQHSVLFCCMWKRSGMCGVLACRTWWPTQMGVWIQSSRVQWWQNEYAGAVRKVDCNEWDSAAETQRTLWLKGGLWAYHWFT